MIYLLKNRSKVKTNIKHPRPLFCEGLCSILDQPFIWNDKIGFIVRNVNNFQPAWKNLVDKEKLKII